MSGQVPALEQSEAKHEEEAGREQYVLAEALCDTAAALNSTLKLEEVLERILANVGRVVPHDAANIMLIESGIAQIIVRSQGYSERKLSEEEVLALRFSVADVSSLSQMAETSQPVAIPDTQNDPGWVMSPETRWVRSYVGAPICLERKVIGSLNLGSATPGFFTPVHAERLRVFADQAAVAIGKARLYESERHRRRIAEMLLETSAAVASSLDLGRVLLTLAGRLLDISGFHICTISEWDREEGQTRALAERARAIWPPGGGATYRLSDYPTTEQVLTTGVPGVVHVGMPDAGEAELGLMREQGFQALLMLPLRARGETIGLVEIGSPQSGYAFDQTTALRCQPILRDAASRLTSPLRANSDAALLALAVQLAAASGGPSCAISAWQRLEGKVRTAVEYSDSIWSPGEGPTQRLADHPGLAYALKRNTSVVARLSDPISSPVSRGILAKWGTQTLVIQPLSVKGEPIGLIELYDVAEEQTVKGDELRLWRAVADQAAVAIKNAQLYAAERHERVLAQTLQETAEALASSVHLGNTLSLIIEQLGKVLHYDHAMIMLIEDDRLRIVAAGGLPNQDQVLGTTYHYPDIPLFHESMSTGKPLVLPDAQKAPRWTQLPDSGTSIRGWIGVPLIAWDAVIGFLSIGSNQPDAYSARDAEAVTAFAQQAAVAVENARILTELETSLSDLRQAQAHLMRTARLSAAGEVAAGVAHQINNPLTAVIAESHLLLKRLAPDSPEHESVVAIQQAAHRAGSVAQRLLNLSRPRPFEMHPLDVNLSIQSAISLVAAQIEPIARLAVDLAPGLPMIEGSEDHLAEVWINLLINARDAVGKVGDGVIKVTTGLDVNGDAIEVAVQDNGAGISAEHLERVFDPFFTTKEQGTGLGLSICHDIVTRHGGSIRVESKEGQGATFTVTLPLNKPA
jgi:signal transduction histidine kinase